MSSFPRHRQDAAHTQPPSSYTGPIAVSSRDFDAVAPLRHPARYVAVPEARQPSGEGPAQWSGDDALSTADSLYLAHS
jgi:hypothetical protein